MCKDENGNKPCMINPACETRASKDETDEEDISEPDDTDQYFSRDSDEEIEDDIDVEEESNVQEQILRKASYVKVVRGAYKGY